MEWNSCPGSWQQHNQQRQGKTQNGNAYHEGIVERSEDMRNPKHVLSLANGGAEGGVLLRGLLSSLLFGRLKIISSEFWWEHLQSQRARHDNCEFSHKVNPPVQSSRPGSRQSKHFSVLGLRRFWVAQNEEIIFAKCSSILKVSRVGCIRMAQRKAPPRGVQ